MRQTSIVLRLLSISNRAKNHIVALRRASLLPIERGQPHFASQYLFIAHHMGQISLRTHFLRAAYR